MANTQSLQAGTQEAWLMFLDSSGEWAGRSTTPLTAAQSQGAYKFRGIQELPTGIPESEAVPIPGDDTILGQILFSGDAPREFVVNMGQQDLVLEAAMQHTNVVTVAGARVGLVDPGTLNLASCSLIVQGKAIIDGLAGWSGWMYPFVQLQPLNRETFSGREAGVIRYKGVAQLAYYYTWGTTIYNDSNTPTSGYAMPFISTGGPLTMHAFRGAITSMTVDQSPISVAAADAYVDKVALTISSVNTPTPRLVTFSAPSPADRPGRLIYEYSA